MANRRGFVGCLALTAIAVIVLLPATMFANEVGQLREEIRQWADAAEKWKRVSERFLDEKNAAEERTRIALDAKDHWMERAVRAESILAAEATSEAASRETT